MLWVFGGRLVDTRTMTNTLYSLDLKTFTWHSHVDLPGDPPPRPRYFHSADQVGENRLVIFGGMGQQRACNNVDSAVLDDVYILDVTDPRRPRWQQPQVKGRKPRARYAHLTAVDGHRLMVIGGQDVANAYVEDVFILDLDKLEWVQSASFPKQCGVYRSIALHYGNWTYVYSNYSFTEVRRELQIIKPDLSLIDASRRMNGDLPPGLRFPTGHLVGRRLVVSGIYLTTTSEAFSIWLLDMERLAWARLECSNALQMGSWNRAVADPRRNRYLILGHSERGLLKDYEHRRVNFDHVVTICLESYSVYTIPLRTISVPGQELGLMLLDRPQFSDFEIRVPQETDTSIQGATDTENRIGSSDTFAERPNNQQGDDGQGAISLSRSTSSSQLKTRERTIYVNTHLLRERWPHFERLVQANTLESRPRCLRLPVPYVVMQQLLKYLYSGEVDQSSVVILGELMLVADTYDVPDLLAHAANILHGRIDPSTAPIILYYAKLARRNGLYVRALRTMRRHAMLYERSVGFWQLPDETRAEIISYLPDNFPRVSPAPIAAVVNNSGSTSTRDNDNLSQKRLHMMQNIAQNLLPLKNVDLAPNISRPSTGGGSIINHFNINGHVRDGSVSTIARHGVATDMNGTALYTNVSPHMTDNASLRGSIDTQHRGNSTMQSASQFVRSIPTNQSTMPSYTPYVTSQPSTSGSGNPARARRH
jgi:hypothetical protein